MLRGLEPTGASSPRECFGSTTCPGLVTLPRFFLQIKAQPFPRRAICFFILIKAFSAPARAEGKCREGLGSGPQARVKLPWCMPWGPSSPTGDSSAFLKKIIVFIFGYAGSLWLGRLFPSCGKQGPFSSCGAWASHCGGCSFCGAWALGFAGFSSCSTWAPEHRVSSHGEHV